MPTKLIRVSFWSFSKGHFARLEMKPSAGKFKGPKDPEQEGQAAGSLQRGKWGTGSLRACGKGAPTGRRETEAEHALQSQCRLPAQTSPRDTYGPAVEHHSHLCGLVHVALERSAGSASQAAIAESCSAESWGRRGREAGSRKGRKKQKGQDFVFLAGINTGL